jgi:N-acetylmuramoyl-L-alanine amidase
MVAVTACGVVACSRSPAPRPLTGPPPGATRAPVEPTTQPARLSAPPDVVAKALTGDVVGIDPGHNGGNFTHPQIIDRLIWNGREKETCNTTGTATDSGYTEAQFNFNVATSLARDLRREGAIVVLTRHNNRGVGPCVNERARIIDRAHADVAIDIHADGGPADGRGFALLEPVADGPNNRIIRSSELFGRIVRSLFQRETGMPTSTYDGTNGIAFRNDLGGLNLTTVPEVLIECGNMRNRVDAALLTSRRFQVRAARALADATRTFLARSRASQ